MRNKVILSFHVSLETRKMLKKMAIEQERTMAEMLEELIILKWQEFNTKNGTIQSFYPATGVSDAIPQ